MTKLLTTITRDPVFWVILPLALVIAPHLPRLPMWMPLLVLGLFALRLGAILQPRLMPRKFWLFVIAALTSAGTVLHYGTLFGKAAGSAVLICLLAIKLLESRSTRDYMLLIALSFFIIVTNFLFTQNIPTAGYMLFTVVVLVSSLISLHQGNADLNLGWRLRAAFKLVALALPLMLVMFILFPRIAGPLWHLPDDARSGRTGLSDTLSPGNIAQLIQSDEIAFRVEFDGTRPPQNALYWRAVALWYFDGRSWEVGKQNENPRPTLEVSGQPVSYTITLEPHDKTWLFALDMPDKAPANAEYNNNFLIRSREPISSLYRYSLQSFLSYRIEIELSRWEKTAGLKIPHDRNLRSIELAQSWRAQFTQDEDIVRHALQHFNREQFIYTLNPPVTPGDNPVDDFLFTTRRGFCEHYASSFTLLMRAAGIPARVVLGYQGGTVNPVNNVLTVRQSDAHAWSEVWLANHGWVRVDPTAAVAPERVEHNLDSALSATEVRPLYMQIDNSALKQLKFYWDAADNRWKQWVIGYGPKLQQQLMRALLNRDVHYSELAVMLITGIGIITLLLVLLSFRAGVVTESDPIQKLYNRYCARLAKHGLQRATHEGPEDFAQRATARFPAQQSRIALITRIYINSRYRSQLLASELSKMKQLIQQLNLQRS